MRLHVLVEGESEKRFLRIWLRRFLPSHASEVHPHLGKGRLTPYRSRGIDAGREGLLDLLPAKLRAFGKALDPSTDRVLVLVDADRDDCRQLKDRLVQEIRRCEPAPAALVRIAVEELESFYLGDRRAVQAAYPNAKLKRLNHYQPDSICGAAELFRDLIGARRVDKVAWAEAMAPHLTAEGIGIANRSPSFRHFCRGILRLVGEPER